MDKEAIQIIADRDKSLPIRELAKANIDLNSRLEKLEAKEADIPVAAYCKNVAVKFLDWFCNQSHDQAYKEMEVMSGECHTCDLYDRWLSKYFNPDTTDADIPVSSKMDHTDVPTVSKKEIVQKDIQGGKECPKCKGVGYTERDFDSGNLCSACKGTGKQPQSAGKCQKCSDMPWRDCDCLNPNSTEQKLNTADWEQTFKSAEDWINAANTKGRVKTEGEDEPNPHIANGLKTIGKEIASLKEQLADSTKKYNQIFYDFGNLREAHNELEKQLEKKDKEMYILQKHCQKIISSTENEIAELNERRSNLVKKGAALLAENTLLKEQLALTPTKI
jgi:hypothetical protein